MQKKIIIPLLSLSSIALSLLSCTKGNTNNDSSISSINEVSLIESNSEAISELSEDKLSSLEITKESEEAIDAVSYSYSIDGLEQSYTYKSSYFDHDPIDVNLNLAKFAFVFSHYSHSQESLIDIYTKTGFSYNLELSENYDDNVDPDGISFGIGTRIFNNKKYVIITIRSSKYGAEWGNNFYVYNKEHPEIPNHYGFDAAATKVFNSTKNYINKYNLGDAKFLLTGFSRGAAIATLTATKIIDSSIINNSNLYTYSFESPECLDSGHNKTEYLQIKNFYFENSFVSNIIPRIFNFTRPGEYLPLEMFIQKEDSIYSITGIKNFKISDNNEFIKTGLTSLPKINSAIFETLTRPLDSEDIEYGFKSYSSKENYANNLQDSFSKFISLFINLHYQGVLPATSLFVYLLSLQYEISKTDPTSFDNDALYKTIKDIFDENLIPYDDNEIKTMSFDVLLGARSLYIGLNHTYKLDIMKFINVISTYSIPLHHYLPVYQVLSYALANQK